MITSVNAGDFLFCLVNGKNDWAGDGVEKWGIYLCKYDKNAKILLLLR